MSNISTNFKTLQSFKTDLNADSVEWCPHEPNQNVFVCANYQLNEQNSDAQPKRSGKILLFSLSLETGLELHQSIDSVGVLDQKWCHNKLKNQSILGIVTATGQIVIYKLISEKLSLASICTYNVTTPDTLLLSLDWSTGLLESSEPNIVCSDSKGTIHLLKFSYNSLITLGSWKKHINSSGLVFEVWIAGFYYWDPNTFFSGGDDAVFYMYDERVDRKTVTKNTSHSAGVTSLHSNSSEEYIVATGSYDQCVRLWDIRSIKNEISTIRMPGEVWRVKWDPFRKKMLLTACMYNGVHIVDFGSITEGKIVGSYYEHGNISYGIDWSYLNQNDSMDTENKYLIGSCSFYDNLLCISHFHNKNVC